MDTNDIFNKSVNLNRSGVAKWIRSRTSVRRVTGSSLNLIVVFSH